MSEQYTYPFPRPSVTVDTIIVRATGPVREVLLIERGKAPFQGHWALPGGFLDMDEELEAAARRELLEETGLKLDRPLTQIGTFGTVGRDPRGRTITVAYGIVLNAHEGQQAVIGQDDATRAQWFPTHALPALAFDHQEILSQGLAML